jgi:hypothetical protein
MKDDVIQKFINKVFLLLSNEETKKYIQIYLIDPILNHVLERLFPYIIVSCVLIIILIISILTICTITYYQIY